MTQVYKIQVSMNQAHLVGSGLVFKQGDFGFQIEIEVLDFDVTGATPRIIFRKPNGAVESTSITVSGNKFTYTIRGTELDTPGPCICDLKLKNSTTQRISTASFRYFVEPDTMDGLNQQANSYSDTIEQLLTPITDELGDVSEDWDADRLYYDGEYVFYNNQLYRRKVISTAVESSFISTRWTEAELADMLYKVDARTLYDANNLLFSRKYTRLNAYYNTSFSSSNSFNLVVVPVKSGTTYYSNHNMRFVSKIGVNIAQNVYQFTADADTDYYITFNKEENPLYILAATSDFSNIIPYVIFKSDSFDRFQRAIDNRNLLNAAKSLVRGSYYDTAAHTNSSYSYMIIQVTSGSTYYIKSARFVSKAGTVIAQRVTDYAYTADFTGDLIITFSNTDLWIVAVQEDLSNIAPYNAPSFTVDALLQETGSDTRRPMSQAAVTQVIQSLYDGSILKGKKWVACGDSFTNGDFTGLQESEYKFQDEPYQGENMVYPFWIGRRSGCNVVNEAKNGSTMAYIDGSRSEFSTPNGRYTQIPNDADYITLYFGINDSHQNVPIGTINDNTNTTFYGAWNIVMEYLITNHPNAKIGIIISNGCDSVDYPNATIEIAKKWGVAYLDMNGDYRIPLTYRVNGKPNLSQTLIDLRTAQYKVSSNNGHPNVACHKDESTFIQSWLESI